MTTLPILELGDDPFERGLVHGRELRAEVADNLDTYLKRFAAGGLDTDAVRREGHVWAEVIAKQNPDYAEEMRGLAEGAEQELSDIAMLNARYEITYGVFGNEAQASDKRTAAENVDGCTSYGVLSEATTNGHTLMGQNWDWLVGVYGRCAILRIRRVSQPDMICFTEAGIVGGKIGVNEHGIGTALNGLVSVHDGKYSYEKPCHVRCREVLDAESFDKALLPVVSTRRVSSANFVIGHGDGEVIDLETSPDEVSYLYPRDGLVTHANHFIDPRHGPSQMERIVPDTLYRAERLDRLLRKDLGDLDAGKIKDALKDHFGAPNSICRHTDPADPPAKAGQTNASLVIDLSARTMEVAYGPPCSNPYVSYALDAEPTTQVAE
ncbi:MAG: peptidase C45 [Rhodospirillales bacterium]|nr:peptidase C45 [Rhodospirillales bacterium]